MTKEIRKILAKENFIIEQHFECHNADRFGSCDECKMKEEHFNSRADALKAIVGCRNPFQLKETCECHLPFRKVAEESIQQVLLEEILKEIEKI